MDFGGFSHFGGGSFFGGLTDSSNEYYRLLKDMRPPGVFSEDDNALCCRLLKGDAALLGDHAQAIVDAYKLETFPSTCTEKIEDWEEALNILPPGGSTTQSRRETITARWRGRVGSTLADLRAILDTLLNSTCAFYDDFEDESLLSFGRAWEITDGNGVTSETSGFRTLDLVAAEDGRWTEAYRRGPINLIKLVDRDDNFTVIAKLYYASLDPDNDGNREMGGVMLYQDDTHALKFGVRQYENVYTLDMDSIEEEITEGVASVAMPSLPFWLKIQRVNSSYIFSYSTDVLSNGTYTVLNTYTSSRFKAKYVGLFLKNTDEMNESQVVFSEFQISYEKTKNNVEIIEPAPEDLGSQDQRFFAFVYSDPSRRGTVNLKEAQRSMDRAKQGHTLITVGESRCFLCDDPYSLCDRDILGV